MRVKSFFENPVKTIGLGSFFIVLSYIYVRYRKMATVFSKYLINSVSLGGNNTFSFYFEMILHDDGSRAFPDKL